MSPENEMPTEDAFFDNAIDPSPPPPADPPAPPAQNLPEGSPPAVEKRTEPPPPDPAAPKPSDPPAEPRPSVDDNAPLIPSWRLREITDEKRAAQVERDTIKAERDRLALANREFERRIAALEKPADAKPEEAPDPLLDPKGYRDFVEKRFEERLIAERREFSLQQARKIYREEFDQAYAAAQQLVDPTLRFHMQRSADPGETLIAWFRDLKIRAEVGNDPAAYKKRVRDEALKDPEFRKAAMEAWRDEAPATGADGRPNVQLAPSLNGVSRSNAQLRTALQADMPDDALFDNIVTRKR